MMGDRLEMSLDVREMSKRTIKSLETSDSVCPRDDRYVACASPSNGCTSHKVTIIVVLAVLATLNI